MVKIMSMKTAVVAGLLVLGMTAGAGVTYAVQIPVPYDICSHGTLQSPCGRVDQLQRLAR